MVAVQQRFNVFCSEIFRLVWPTVTFFLLQMMGWSENGDIKIANFCSTGKWSWSWRHWSQILATPSSSEKLNWSNWELIESDWVVYRACWACQLLVSEIWSMQKQVKSSGQSLRDHFLCRWSDWDTLRINLFCREFAWSAFDCYYFLMFGIVFLPCWHVCHIVHNTLHTLLKDLVAIARDPSHYYIYCRHAGPGRTYPHLHTCPPHMVPRGTPCRVVKRNFLPSPFVPCFKYCVCDSLRNT